MPGELGRALKETGTALTRGEAFSEFKWWAVHPGGRSILDSVEKNLELPADSLACSREILAKFGNMSSATVMFVMQLILERGQSGEKGCAMSFGPGLTAETMLFHLA